MTGLNPSRALTSSAYLPSDAFTVPPLSSQTSNIPQHRLLLSRRQPSEHLAVDTNVKSRKDISTKANSDVSALGGMNLKALSRPNEERVSPTVSKHRSALRDVTAIALSTKNGGSKEQIRRKTMDMPSAQDKAEKLFKEVSARTRTGQKHTIGENLAAVRLPSPHPDSRRSKVPKNSFNPQDPLTTSALPSTDRTFLHSGHFPKSQSFSSLRIDSPSTSLAGTSKIDDGAAIEASFSSDFLPSNGHLTPVNPRRHGRGKSLGSCDSRRRAIYDSTVQISDPLYSGNIPSQWITFDSFTSLGQAQAESSPIRTAHSILPAAFDRSDTISSPQHSFHTTSSPFDTSLGNPGAHGHAGYSRSPANFLHLTKGQIKGKRRSVPVGMHVADSGGGTVPNVPAIPAIYLPSNATESVPECRVPLAERCHHPIVKQLMLDLDRAIEEWDMISLTI